MNGYRPRLGQAPNAQAAPDVWPEWYVYSADFVGTAQQLAAGTLNGRPSVQVFATFTIRMDGDAHFRWMKTQYVATDARVYARFRDDTAGRYLMRGTPALSAIAGIAAPYPFVNGAAPAPGAPTFQPYIWQEPYVIPAMSALSVEAADFSAVANAVRIALHGAKLRPGRAPWDRPGRRMQYWVEIPGDDVSPSITANATIAFSVSIDNEADFVVTKITGERTGACLLQITDGRDRNWFSTAQHFDNVVGNGGFPNILPAPRFVQRGSTLYGTIQDLSAATNIVRLTLHGYRLYD